MGGMSQIDGMIEDALRKRRNARSILYATGDDESIKEAVTNAKDAQTRLDNADIAEDDGIPPTEPQGVNVFVFGSNITVTWNLPPQTDYVKYTYIRFVNPATVQEVDKLSTTDIYLDYIKLESNTTYEAYVQFQDRWNRLSAESVGFTFTTGVSVADQIDESTLAFGRDVADILNAPELAAISDPGKLANKVVKEAALSMSGKPNLLSYDVASVDPFEVGTTNLPNASGLTGGTVEVVEFEEQQTIEWHLLSASDALGTNFLFNRYLGPPLVGGKNGEEYIVSCTVKCRGGKAVNARLVYRQKDINDVQYVVTGADVNLQPGEEKTIYVLFDYSSAHTDDNRIQIDIDSELGDGFLTYLNHFMLQRADGKGEPGAYKPPGISTGVVSARLLTAWDLAATRAIIGDATIETALIANAAIGDAQIDRATANKLQVRSADIVSLTASSLTSGTIDAQTITLGTGGVLASANNETTFTSSGIQLVPSATSLTGSNPSAEAERSISVAGGWSAMAFFEGNAYRGLGIRADGEGDGIPSGYISLIATQNSFMTKRAATIRLVPNGNALNEGVVSMTENLNVTRSIAAANINATEAFYCGGFFNGGGNIFTTGGDIFTNNGRVYGERVGFDDLENAFFTDVTLGSGAQITITHSKRKWYFSMRVWELQASAGRWRDATILYGSQILIDTNPDRTVIRNDTSDSKRFRCVAVNHT